jgi:hypothetical protein
VAINGNPQDMASSAANGKPSPDLLGKIEKSAAL